MASPPPKVFVSYSRADEKWKDRLVEHLRVLELEGRLDLWDDGKIAAGDEWRREIETGPGDPRSARGACPPAEA